MKGPSKESCGRLTVSDPESATTILIAGQSKESCHKVTWEPSTESVKKAKKKAAKKAKKPAKP